MDRSLRRLTIGSYYLVLDQIVNYGLGAVFWIVLARLVEPAIIGQVMLVTAMITAVLGFSGYGAMVMMSKYIAEFNASKMYSSSKKVLKLGLRIGLIVSGITALIFSLLSNHIAESVYHDGSLTALIIIGVLAILPSQTIMWCFNGAYQGSQRMKYTALADIMYQGSRVAIAVVLVIMGLGGTGILLAIAFGSILAIAWGYLFFIPKVFTAKQSSPESFNVRKVMRFSGLNYLAIGVSMLGVQVIYLLLGMHSFDSVAFFGVATLFSSVVAGIVVSVGKAVLPTTSEEWTNGKKENLSNVINSAFRISIMLSGFIYIVFMLAPDQILALASKEYVAVSSVFRILAISSITVSIADMVFYMLNGMGKPEKVVKMSVASAAVLIGFSLVLVPMLELIGAALSVLISSVFNLMIAIYYIRKEREIFFSYWNIAKPLISASMAISTGYLILSVTHNIVFALSTSILCYLAFVRFYQITTIGEIKELVRFAINLSSRDQNEC